MSAKVVDIHTAQQRKDAAALVEHAQPVDPMEGVDPDTQDGLALSFVAEHPLLRYVAAWGKWYQFDGQRWKEDDTLHVYDLVRGHCRTHGVKAAAALVHAVMMLCRASRKHAATTGQWDRDPWLIATPNGTVDLQTGKLSCPEPDRYLTKLTAAAPTGSCPLWMHFLQQVTDGDKQYAAFLQRVAGYCATGLTREQCLFFLYGTGGNGKGTFINTLQYVLGDYAMTAPTEMLLEHHGDRHPTDVAGLRGARLVVAQETDEGRAWNESLLKTMTGGDRITAHFMRQDNFTFDPQFKLLVAGNHKPRLRSVDAAIQRRFHLLPFEQQFLGAKTDKQLAKKLEAEAGGILHWVIQGAKQYASKGLTPPKVVADATSEYLDHEDVVKQWLAECCEHGAGFNASSEELFASWTSYALGGHERVGHQRDLNDKLRAMGFELRHTKHGSRWSCIQLKRLVRASLAENAQRRSKF